MLCGWWQTLPAQQREAVRQRQVAYLSQCYNGGGGKPAGSYRVQRPDDSRYPSCWSLLLFLPVPTLPSQGWLTSSRGG